MPVSGYAAYIKISRIDKNGVNQTNTLQSLDKLTIPYSTGNVTYSILSIVEKPTFFQYYVQPQGDNVEWDDRAELKYDFTGSVTNESFSIGNSLQTQSPDDYQIISVEKDPLKIYNSSTKELIINTYPQKSLHFELSGSYSGSVGSPLKSIFLYASNDPINNPFQTLIGSQTGTVTGTTVESVFVTGSFQPTSPATKIIINPRFQFTGGPGKLTFINTKLFITSSDATGTEFGIVPEPYFGDNDFLRALDCQPLLNNAEDIRFHNLYQDIDYSAGATEPVNFDLLINGTATRAKVNISDYTQESRIIPRYKGSKSTSEKLNVWTENDIGTYGKSPTIQSSKRMIAYSDGSSGGIGGWPPEKMNASTIFIRYLIDENGDVKIPNTSENVLQDVQGTFQTGERVLISAQTAGSGEATPYRKIIRGGQRIEPILYTQSGSAPGSQWVDINFEDIQTVEAGAIANFQNNGSIGAQSAYNMAQRLQLNSQALNSSLINSGTAFSLPYNFYTVPLGAVQEGVDLNFQIYGLKIGFFTDQTDTKVKFKAGVILKIGNDTFGIYQQTFPATGKFNRRSQMRKKTFDTINLPVPSTTLLENQEISFELVIDMISGQLGQHNVVGNTGVKIEWGAYNITQTPIPTIPVSPGLNNIWGYHDKVNYPYVITSSLSSSVVATLGSFYKDPNIRQKSTLGSGFNPIALPWSLEIGDEFRFEGEERYTHMVINAFGPNESSDLRITETGSIEVQFDKNLPVSASSSAFNLDHFLIRRYVDDASQIIIEGFKPENSAGPYIITPEYSTPKINKSIDEYITILTEKNLLS